MLLPFSFVFCSRDSRLLFNFRTNCSYKPLMLTHTHSLFPYAPTHIAHTVWQFKKQAINQLKFTLRPKKKSSFANTVFHGLSENISCACNRYENPLSFICFFHLLRLINCVLSRPDPPGETFRLAGHLPRNCLANT